MKTTPLNDERNDFLLSPDPVGSIAYAANFRFYRALQVSCAALLFGLLCSAAGNLWQSKRPPVVLVLRVDDAGRAESIRYNSLNYTPREAEVRSRLKRVGRLIASGS